MAERKEKTTARSPDLFSMNLPGLAMIALGG